MSPKSNAPTRDVSVQPGHAWAWFLLGAALWLAALVVRWPVALTFGDEVGYLGQARLILEGHVHPKPDAPGVWVMSHGMLVAQYNIFLPLLLAPLFALAPRLIFATGALAALGLAGAVGIMLRQWGRRPTWALIVLAHPTVIIIARTVMSDLLQAAFAVGAWCALRRGRRALGMSLIALTVLAKPTGFLLAFALCAGETVRWLRARDDQASASGARWSALGIIVGIGATVVMNLISAGKVWYGYSHTFLPTPLPFWPTYLTQTGPVHIASLLLMPPLLIAGAAPLWRRREYGPLFVAGGLSAMMCFYFFVDRGRNWLETLVMAPRLILPAVAFLLIGYIDLIARWIEGQPVLRRPVSVLLLVASTGAAFAISARHRAFQEPEGAALRAASTFLARSGNPTLGLTYGAMKAGMLYDHHTVMAPGRSADGPPLVLCGTRSPSYRAPGIELGCALPGYDDLELGDGFHLLTRRRP